MKGFNFCPFCGTPLHGRIVMPGGHQDCRNCGQIIYWNAKPCATALIIRQSEILLVRRAGPPYKGYWDLPGGFCDYGEHPEEAIKREVAEELGVGINIIRLFGIFTGKYGKGGVHVLDCHYLASLRNEGLTPASDIDGYAWFPPDRLPAKIAFAQIRQSLREWKNLAERPGTCLV